MLLKNSDGCLQVITGPMFSGKTAELLKRIKILQIADLKTLVVKPRFDNRFSETELISRTGAKIQAKNIEKADDIWSLWNDEYRAVAIDEINFLNEEIIEVIEKLVAKGVIVICSGLDMDFLRRPFGITPKIMAIADKVTKLKAVCVVCKANAGFSFRKNMQQDINSLGDNEYEARCRACHIKGERKKKRENK